MLARVVLDHLILDAGMISTTEHLELHSRFHWNAEMRDNMVRK